MSPGVGGWATFLFCSSLLLPSSFAPGGETPDVEWTRSLAQAVKEQTECLEETSDGGFIVSGRTLLMKTDESGAGLWESSFENLNFAISSIRETSDQGYILAGTFHGHPQGIGIFKLDAQGTILWQQAPVGQGFDSARSVALTTDGGYVVAGASSFSEGSDPYVFKTDRDGNIVWERTYQEEFSEAGTYAARETRDGGFILVGPKESEWGVVEGPYLLKIDRDGDPQWERVLKEDGAMDLPAAIRELDDGGYLLAGAMYPGAGLEGYLRKTDAEGNILWTRRFSGYGLSLLLSLSLTSDGGAVAAGFTQVPPGGAVDIYLLRVDQAGALLWEKPIPAPEREIGVGVVQTRDGGYAICARSTMSDGTDGGLLIKIAPEGSPSEALLRRGDAQGEGVVDLSDAIFTLNYLFLGGAEPPCLDSSDADDDGVVTITDGIRILQYLFLGAEPPAPPGPNTCGADPTPDALSCQSGGSCAGNGP